MVAAAVFLTGFLRDLPVGQQTEGVDEPMKLKYALTVCLFAIFTVTGVYAQDIWNGGTG
jgi:hypothetical protein